MLDLHSLSICQISGHLMSQWSADSDVLDKLEPLTIIDVNKSLGKQFSAMSINLSDLEVDKRYFIRHERQFDKDVKLKKPRSIVDIVYGKVMPDEDEPAELVLVAEFTSLLNKDKALKNAGSIAKTFESNLTVASE